MKRDIARLKSEYFDILIIGGGINGVATARDAAMRGAKVALIEKNDFASGASGKTTKLIHGGIRYLEQFNFKLVYEALHERSILLKTASHSVSPLEFIMPVYKNDPRPFLKIKTGIYIYDILAGSENISAHRVLSASDIISMQPGIEPEGLEGGVLYCDAQMDDIALCLDNAMSAYDAGACLANKVEASGLIKEKGKAAGIEALDKLTLEKFAIRASIVINTTGAWSNSIVKMDEPDAEPITRPTKGIHIIYNTKLHHKALVLSAHKDKRIFFIIPWRNYTIIGTTDTDFMGSPDEVYAQKSEVDYLINETRRVFPEKHISTAGIITTYAGLRPLVNTKGMPEWQVSREHMIKESASGLISVIGGKYTTYRRLAEQLTDMALAKLKDRSFKKCATAKAGPVHPELNTHDLKAIAERAVNEEMANSLLDLLFRRLALAATPSRGLDRVEECAGIMARMLGWAEEQKTLEIALYKEEVNKNSQF